MANCSPPEQITQLYKSLPLGNDGDAIRVMDILPGRKDSDIKITIRTTRLSSDIAYEALSYTWGESLEHNSILVQGYRIGITDNLCRALRRLRRQVQRRTVWIDQLCINQADCQERSQQVGIMHRIYENARSVHVWLGEAKRSWPSSVLDKLVSYLRHVSEYRGGSRYKLKQMRRGFMDCNIHRLFLEALLNRPEMIQQAIQSTTPCWLDRAWIVQEFSFAKRVYFWCGPVAFQYSSERLFLMAQRYNNDEVHRLFGRVNTMQHVLRRHLAFEAKRRAKGHSLKHHVGIDIYDIVEWIHGFKATNPIDLVYSVLGLIVAEQAAIIGSNYSLTQAEVFARATYASIKFRNDFDVMRFVPGTPITPELPTWSLDFAHKRLGLRYNVVDTYIPKDAPGGVSVVALDRTNRLLTISAASMGTVLDTFVIWSRPSTFPDWIQRLWNFIAHGCALIDSQKRDGCWSGFEEALGLLRRPDNTQKPNEQRKGDFQKTMSSHLTGYRKGDILDRQSLLVLLSDAFSMWASGTGTPYRTHRHRPPSNKFGSSTGSKEVWEFTSMYDSASPRDDSLVLFVTSTGLIGIAPNTLSKDDQVVLVPSERPFVGLRKKGAAYSFCGQVWVWGISGLEVARYWTKLDMAWEQYILC